MRIAFIGHQFHERSKSTQFFQQILHDLGEVERFTADPDSDGVEDDTLIADLLCKSFDCYVFLQTEFLAERLRPLISGRIVIVPMYDGACGRPDNFWRQFVRAQFISFCRTHHEHLVELDCRSTSFQYFPPVEPAPERGAGMRSAFFWERRPDQAINFALVLDLCRQLDVETLHVHAAPDFDRLSRTGHRQITRAGNISVTWSNWFDRREDYEAVATTPLFFFAPRLREGIGMAVLEAMSSGQIVVAPDLPTMNEYISHATTGILYNPDKPEIDLSSSTTSLLQMSTAARKKAEIGRTQWLADIERLKSVLLDDGRRWSTDDAGSHFLNGLRSAASRRVFKHTARRIENEGSP